LTAGVRPFVDAPAGPPGVTGPAAAVAAERWGLASPVLVRTGMNAIYVAEDVVLRVAATTAPAEAALELAAVLTAAGVRVPAARRPDVVRHGRLSVTAWERLHPAVGADDWRAVGAMVRRVHELADDELPTAYPRPPAAAFPWWQFETLLTAVSDELDGAARSGLETAIDRHRWWTAAESPLTTCHGDVHPGNVMATVAGPVLLDWDLLCRAPAAWDHAMLVRAERWAGCDPAWYDAFAAGYGWCGRDDPLLAAISELRLAAATLMRLVAGRADPAATVEARRRLAYWRGDPDAPRWTAV